MQLAPSKNPEKESKLFAKLGLGCAVASLLFWFASIAGLAFSTRAIILSKRVGDKNSLTMSIAGLIVSLIVFALYYIK